MKRASKRTDRVRYVDPKTGIPEYRYVEKVTYRYDEEEKVPIIIEFLKGQTEVEEMVDKYHITLLFCDVKGESMKTQLGKVYVRA